MSNERLAKLKRYLKEAQLEPENNELYIADLKLSIKHFERLNLNEVEVRNDEVKFD